MVFQHGCLTHRHLPIRGNGRLAVSRDSNHGCGTNHQDHPTSESRFGNVFTQVGTANSLKGTILGGLTALLATIAAVVNLVQNNVPIALLSVVVALTGYAAMRSFGVQMAAANERIIHLTKKSDRTSDQLNRQRRTVEALADGLETAIFICNGQAEVRYANRRAKELFRTDEPVGQPLIAVTLSHELEQLVQSAVQENSAQVGELTFSHPVERIGLAKAWPGVEQAVFLSIYEITELRRLERVRKDFVSNVSHEFRTPLTIIRSMAETLHDEKPPSTEMLDRYLPKIIDEVDRLAAISSDLLILSSAETNAVVKERCDLAALCQQAIDQLARRAGDKGIEVRFVGSDSLIVPANVGQMRQVILNLLENAIQYSKDGEIVVEIHSDDQWATLKVSDSGLGIPSEHHSRIFERFYRVDRSRSRESGGTGLGLSIVRHIVEAHGGSVQVESALNVGSTFEVRLPLDGTEKLDETN